MKFRYTLIITHYNQPELLSRLLQTVPQRTDLQVIVVDDCSSETYQERYTILKDSFKWVEFYSTGSNGGGGKARNIGLLHAHGDYILFADGDDEFTKNLDYLLDKHKTTDYDMIYCGALFFNDAIGKPQESNFINIAIAKYLSSRKERFVRLRSTCPWAKIFKKSIIDKNGIKFEESIISNDVKFTTLCEYYSPNFKVEERVIYVYHILTGSTSRTLSKERLLTRLRIDLERHVFLKSVKWFNYKPYEYSLFLICDTKDKSIWKETLSMCKKYGVGKFEIYKFLLKRKIKKVFKRI